MADQTGCQEASQVECRGLLDQAKTVAQHAYAPYSRFAVGAALLCADGEVVTGVNVENASYGLTLCAERSAIAAAVSRSKREFTALAVWARPFADNDRPDKDQPGPVTPCGACRQVMQEFFKPNTPIIFEDATGQLVVYTMAELLPEAFDLSS